MGNGRIGVLGLPAPEPVLEKMGYRVQDLVREIAFLPSMEETHVIRKDIRKLNIVQVTEAPLHIALWMVCGQVGGTGAAVAKLVVEEEEQEIASAETNSTMDVPVKAKTTNLNSVS